MFWEFYFTKSNFQAFEILSTVVVFFKVLKRISKNMCTSRDEVRVAKGFLFGEVAMTCNKKP